MTERVLFLDGRSLTLDRLVSASCRTSQIQCDPNALLRMNRARQLLNEAAASGEPIYGVTRALGARSGEALAGDPEHIALATIRSRAHAAGPFEKAEIVRASMIIRLNTFLLGHSGARRSMADHLLSCLNAGLTPVVRSIGSIGAADLTTNASLALTLLGEGQMQSHGGRVGPSKAMMLEHDISPLVPEGRDGLALISHSSMTVASSALAIHRAATVFEAAQTAAALSLEGFRSGLAPFDPRVLAIKPLPGQSLAAEGLLRRLAGSRLFEAGEARRLQDPLSFRNIAQIHGVTASALVHARKIVEIEMNGSSDNPAVLLDDERVVTSGSYFSAELGHAVEGLSRSLVGLAFAQLARMSRHLDPDFSGLPLFLGELGTNGFAPLMKTAESVLQQLTHAAQPASLWPSINANGVEDCLSTAPIAAKNLEVVATHSARLTAIELVIALRAIALRAGIQDLPAPLAEAVNVVQSIGGDSPAEPLGERIEQLAGAILQAELSLNRTNP